MTISNHPMRLSKDVLAARRKVIEKARARFRGGEPEAESEIRRIARLLSGLVDHSTAQRLAQLAAALETGQADAFDSTLEHLLGELDQLLSASENQQATILVVEDDPIAALILGANIEAPTRSILYARNASEAEETLRNHVVSLVLLDLGLPDSDGRNFLVELRSRSELDGVPVIISSADNSTATKAECYNLGADEFFEKPISPEVLGAAVTSKLQRAREIFLQSKIDKLTGVGNRGAVSDAFQRLEFLVDRTDYPFSLGILDVDRFKRVNDDHGHPTGDLVLKGLAQVLTRNLREGDVIGRWGGEEFVVMFPNTDAGNATAVLSTILKRFRERRFEAPSGESFSVSFSGGVVGVRPGEGLERALERADALMYEAKEAGRNRIHSEPVDSAVEVPRLLLVVRDPILGRSAQYRLRKEGFHAEWRRNAAEALQLASEFEADLLVVEMELPDMSGLSLLDRFNTLQTYRNLPVVMLADSERESPMEEGFWRGVSDFVALPLSHAELVTRIRRLLGRYPLLPESAAGD